MYIFCSSEALNAYDTFFTLDDESNHSNLMGVLFFDKFEY
jgi:hypothetical protein